MFPEAAARRRRSAICARWCRPRAMRRRQRRKRRERGFLNLIGNAVEAMPAGGTLQISELVDGESVRIHFADSGPGILPSIREKLFEPFVSAGKKNGLGLGLALSRQTVLDHGGEIWVEPGAPGARFVIRLPIKQSQA